jgi:hypothetical protein
MKTLGALTKKCLKRFGFLVVGKITVEITIMMMVVAQSIIWVRG